VARKKKQHEEETDRPAPVPNVGTSMKGLLKGVSLAKLDEAAKAEAAEKAAHASANRPKPSQGHTKPSQGHAKPSQGHAKPSQAHAKPSQALPKPSLGQSKPSGATSQHDDASAAPSGTTVVARPSDSLKGHDRTAFYDAIAGVRALDQGRPKPRRAVPVKTSEAVAPPPREDIDAPVRKKLGELVGGAHRFDVAIEDDGFVEGLRRDAPVEALGALRRDHPRVDATLDLHGLRESIVDDRLARWIREAHKKGARRVLVIHGKGLHSSDGVAVLRDAVLRVLETSIATPLVLAFASAPPAMGGTGATLVELTRARS
jgi:DNA-nicking Smr family endonuclease